MERVTAEGGPLERAVAPGGLIDELLAEEGLVERLLAEDGLAERLMAKGGLIDMLTARNGPLEQTVFVAETLNKLAPNLEALTPTIDMLRDAVDSLTHDGEPADEHRRPVHGPVVRARDAPRPVSAGHSRRDISGSSSDDDSRVNPIP